MKPARASFRTGDSRRPFADVLNEGTEMEMHAHNNS
jgi:hypothetical protein